MDIRIGLGYEMTKAETKINSKDVVVSILSILVKCFDCFEKLYGPPISDFNSVSNWIERKNQLYKLDIV